MTEDAEPAVETDLVGTSIADAIDTLLAADESRERSDVRQALFRVATDGDVSREAARDAIEAARASLQTPASRIDVAQTALATATQRASGLEDVDRVSAELDAFEERLGQLSAIVEEGERDLDALDFDSDSDDALAIDSDSDSLLQIGRTVASVEGDVDAATEGADRLVADVVAFVDWLREPDRKLDEIETDIGQVEELLDLVEETTEEVRTALETGSDARGADPDPLLLWLDGAMRARLVELLLEDLLSELADIKTLADRTDESLHGVDTLATRLEGLESRRQSYADRLDRLERPDWPGEFDDVLSSFRESLESETTPVDWAAVESELEHYRSVIEERS